MDNRIFIDTGSRNIYQGLLSGVAISFMVLLSLPLFINLADSSFFLRNVKDTSYLQGSLSGIPFPFFGFLMVLTFFVLVLYRYRSLIKLLNRNDLVLAAILCAFSLLAFLSGYTITGMLQLLMFPLLLWALSFFRFERSLAKYYLLGAGTFCTLHFFSILSTNKWSLLKPFARSTVYETFFGYQIYQGLISYVSALSIIAVLLIFSLVRQHNKWLTVLHALAVWLVLYLAALSSQRQFAVDLILISIFCAWVAFRYRTIDVFRKTVLLCTMLCVWLFSIFLVNNMAGASAPKRLVDTVLVAMHLAEDEPEPAKPVVAVQAGSTEGSAKKTGTKTGSKPVVVDESVNRIFHMKRVLGEVRDSVVSGISSGRIFQGILVGTGLVHSGSHNFVIDLVSGAGIVGGILYLFFLFLVYFRFFRVVPAAQSTLPRDFLVLLLLIAAAGSMVNSPLTQPYYFINLVFAVAIIVGVDKAETETGVIQNRSAY